MANCRIQKLTPTCEYNLEGVQTIQVLDFDDFYGFRFNNDDLYQNCLVVALFRGVEFTDVAADDNGAKMFSTFNEATRLYTHTIETFVRTLSGTLASSLHLGTKRRFLPLIQLRDGKYYTFGYEAGAKLSYGNQTADAVGSLITIVASSIYPLFEVTPRALTTPYGINYAPDFTLGAYCELA